MKDASTRLAREGWQALGLLVSLCCCAAAQQPAGAGAGGKGEGHSLDVPVSVPGSPNRPTAGTVPALELAGRDRVAVLVSVGLGMGTKLPVVAGAAGSGLSRMTLATTELMPYLQYLSEDTEAVLYEVGSRAEPYCPQRDEADGGGTETTPPPGEAAAEPRADAGGEPDVGEAGLAVPAGPGPSTALPAPPSAADCFRPLEPATRQDLLDHLASLAPSLEPVARSAFLAALTDLLTVPGLQRAFVVSDSLGAAETQDRFLQRLEELLAAKPRHERPRIDVLSLAALGSGADRELRALARMSGGIYLRRP